ncbi:integral membrane protein 2Cb [Genypterus blacodes]|uniref:integral membrane protein 2Cb n=1 Tax=Genypterus blacodes TaxID=154954 RepID=UPI003F75CC0F
MVKITFKPVSAQKPEKEEDGNKIIIPQAHEELDIPIGTKKPFQRRLCCLIVGVVALISGLIVGSFCLYRHFRKAQVAEDNLFQCRLLYVDMARRQQELKENVGIYLDDNYEKISVPVTKVGNPVDIIHDFNWGFSAYYDFSLDSCYITELDTSLVMQPRILWQLLSNVKIGLFSLPQTSIIQEEMAVTGIVRNTRMLGPFIHRLCIGKETYRLKRHKQNRRYKRDTSKCHRIRHSENTFVVETVICGGV